jgi:probable DNA repair protein
MASGHTLLTPNQRAARALRQADDSARRAAGETLWAPLNVLPLESWLAAQWHQRLLAGAESRILLNRSQQHLLWSGIIAADPETPRLRSAGALAEMAARAWSLLHLHEGRERLRDFPLASDARAFERWTRAFERRLARLQSITPAELPAAIAAAPTQVRAETLTLIDFEPHPPALASLFAALERSGFSINVRQSTAPPQTASLFEANDDTSELETAARWIHSRLQADPQARIAVIVPGLGYEESGRRPGIDRVFGPILAPATLPITASACAPIYEFSLGHPLAELPVTIAALDLLTWPHQALPLDRITSLLLSPWFTGATAAVAEFDAFHLRQTLLLRPELGLEATLRLARQSPHPPGSLIARLQALERAAQQVPERQPYNAWAESFRTLLEAARWSDHAASSSLAFQQHRRFQGALDELATLDFAAQQPDAPALPAASAALAAFTRILQQTIFARQSEHAPVQIMGPLELGGTRFDALWFLGADDLAWPATPAPSPLLPWQLQRALAIPGADRTRDDLRGHALTSRIAHSADEVVFSFARRSDEGERRPSPLLSALHLQPLGVAPNPPAQLISAPAALEPFPDDTTLPPLPDRPAGGAGILQHQAACPFRAFAEHRLFSTEPASRTPGFDARERGIHVHAVLQTLWNTLKTSTALRALRPLERETLLADIIQDIFGPIRPEIPWDAAYLDLQSRRLRTLLSSWLDVESRRPPFSVQPTEQKKPFVLGGVTFDLRIDRVDRAGGGDVLLDYKTGPASPAAWLGARPDEPQLPLYALLTDAEARQSGRQLAGVAFAVLRPGDGLALTGFADDDSVFGKTASMNAATLEDQLTEWRQILTNLARAYAAGDTAVDPKLYPRTCSRCTQRMLCRLDPGALVAIPNEDDDDAHA